MSEKEQSGKLLGVLSENILKQELLKGLVNRKEDLSVDYKFVCGKRLVRLCRRITDFSQECFSAAGADVDELSVLKELMTVRRVEDGDEAIKLTTNFFARLLDSGRQQRLVLVLRVEDTFFAEQQSLGQGEQYLFSRKTLEGFLFRDSGLYLQFCNQGNVAVDQMLSQLQGNTASSVQSAFSPLKNSQWSFRFGFEHSETGFTAKGELSCSNNKSIVQQMEYHVEVLTKASRNQQIIELNKDSLLKVQQQALSKKQNPARTISESFCEGDSEETHSQTEAICLNYRQQKNLREKQSELDCSCFLSKALECPCSKQRQSFSETNSSDLSAQPKKNVVKNFVKAFRSFVNNEDQQVIDALGGCSNAQLLEFKQAYRRFEASNNFNNTFVKHLIVNEPFKPVFAKFVQNQAWIWLQNSQVNNKDAHREVLSDYVKATEDIDNIESVYSLRTRKRPVNLLSK